MEHPRNNGFLKEVFKVASSFAREILNINMGSCTIAEYTDYCQVNKQDADCVPKRSTCAPRLLKAFILSWLKKNATGQGRVKFLLYCTTRLKAEIYNIRVHVQKPMHVTTQTVATQKCILPKSYNCHNVKNEY